MDSCCTITINLIFISLPIRAHQYISSIYSELLEFNLSFSLSLSLFLLYSKTQRRVGEKQVFSISTKEFEDKQRELSRGWLIITEVDEKEICKLRMRKFLQRKSLVV